MSAILTDLTPSSLAAANKANLFGYNSYLGRSPAADYRNTPQVTWSFTGIPHPFLNNILRADLSGPDVPGAVRGILEECRARGVTALSWWVEAGTRPANLGETLLACGLEYDGNTPGMAVDLAKLDDHGLSVPGLVIEKVQGPQALASFASVAAAGFELPPGSEKGCFTLLEGLGYDLPLASYLGIYNGEPVAISQVFLGEGVAGIYWVATLPAGRGKGIGAAMTLAPLLDARRMGYRAGILQSSPMGYPVYQRLGFVENCRLPYYTWKV